MTIPMVASPGTADVKAPDGSSEKKHLRVFLADDHAVVRDGLRHLVNGQTDLEVVGEAENGNEAWRRVGKTQPDVVVMDVSMPDCNGLEATARIKADWPHIKVLALTMHEDKSYLRSLMEAGAVGYVLKRSAADELIKAVRVVATGGTYLDPSLSAAVVESFVRRPTPIGVATSRNSSSEGASLSEREGEVLRLIAQGYTNKEIATQLTVSVKTVETYKARSMEKLDLQSRADIVRYALQQGWLRETGTV